MFWRSSWSLRWRLAAYRSCSRAPRTSRCWLPRSRRSMGRPGRSRRTACPVLRATAGRLRVRVRAIPSSDCDGAGSVRRLQRRSRLGTHPADHGVVGIASPSVLGQVVLSSMRQRQVGFAPTRLAFKSPRRRSQRVWNVLPAIMAAGAVAIEDRLDFPREAEPARRAVERP